MRSLGANAPAYSSLTSATADAADWEWCQRKRARVAAEIRRVAGSSLQRLGDIGCRSGREAEWYGREVGAAEVHGFEIAEEPLAAARARGVIGHVWVSGAGPCPVEDGFFDAIVAGDIIEHLFDTDLFLEELWRVLRPGGQLTVTTPNLGWWWSRLRLLRGLPPGGIGGASFRHAASQAVDRKHLRILPAGEWLNLFAAHGFEVDRVIGFNYPRLLRTPLWWADDLMTRRPTLAHSLLFVLRRPDL